MGCKLLPVVFVQLLHLFDFPLVRGMQGLKELLAKCDQHFDFPLVRGMQARHLVFLAVEPDL